MGKPSTNVTTQQRDPGSGKAIKSPLKDVVKSGNTSTRRAGSKD